MSSQEIKDGLRTFICRELLKEPGYPLGDDEPLVTGGLIDSFSLAHVGVFIETAFGVYVPDVEFTVQDMDTIEQMAAQVLRYADR